MVAIIVRIGSAPIGKPSIVIIKVSDIVPPPIGTAVTKSVATRATNSTLPTPAKELISVPNKHT